MAGGLTFLGRSADDTALSPAMQAWLQQQAQEVPAAVAPGYTGYAASTAPAAGDPDKVLTPLGQKWAGDLKDVVTAPQRAYTGELQVWDPATGHTTDAAREAAMGLAGMAMTGGFAGVAPGGVSVGSGPIRAYHGSPHDFDAFSMAKIGSGEGNQAFGKGLYFAGNENVARTYRDALSAPMVGTPEYEAVRALRAASDNRDAAAAQLASQTWSRPGRQPQVAPKTQAAIDMLRSDAPVGGRMYEVQINADPAKMLDFDKPLSQQPHVAEALKPYLGDVQPSMLGGDALNHARTMMRGTEFQPETVLREAGVPGIRFLDNGSRGTGQGTHNYVTFSDDIVSILRKYGLAGMAALGAGAGVLAQPGDAQAASR